MRSRSSVMGPARRPWSRSACRTQWRSVSPEQPIFSAIERIAAYCEPCSFWCSKTMRTARARTSGEYGGVRFVMAPSSQEQEPPGIPVRFNVALDAALGQAHAGHDAVAVTIEPGTAGIQDLHDRLRVCGAGEEPWCWKSRVCAPTLAGVATVRGAQGLRVKLIRGLAAPLRNRSRCRRRPHHSLVHYQA